MPNRFLVVQAKIRIPKNRGGALDYEEGDATRSSIHVGTHCSHAVATAEGASSGDTSKGCQGCDRLMLKWLISIIHTVGLRATAGRAGWLYVTGGAGG